MSRLALGIAVITLAALGGFGVYHFGFATAVSAPESEQFAVDRADGKAVPFDAKRALTYLEAVCKIGPRISGTDGMKKQQELIQKHFESLGCKVEYQRFTARQLSRNEPVEMANLIIRFHPERTRRVILCSHYDTRPRADEEFDAQRLRQPFVSANDGGSGVAFLMEMAHHMKDLKTQVGVDFVLFDGEEYIFDRSRDKYFFGSEHFAATYKKNGPKGLYRSAVLLDMIAGKNPRFHVEQNSWFLASPLVEEVWKIGAELKCRSFINTVKHEVLDDHLALNRAGIPAIDIIDFDYPHWHRLTDTPANCAPEGLEQVAQVLSVWLQRVK